MPQEPVHWTAIMQDKQGGFKPGGIVTLSAMVVSTSVFFIQSSHPCCCFACSVSFCRLYKASWRA